MTEAENRAALAASKHEDARRAWSDSFAEATRKWAAERSKLEIQVRSANLEVMDLRAHHDRLITERDAALVQVAQLREQVAYPPIHIPPRDALFSANPVMRDLTSTNANPVPPYGPDYDARRWL